MLDAFLEIIRLLEKAKIPYCLIGGVAVLMYGGRASTLDLDFYIVARHRKRLIRAIETIGATIEARGEFQYKGSFRGFRFDVLIADRWVGLPAIKRAKKQTFGNTSLNIATAEDVIIMKTLADRPIDRRDIQELREIFPSIDNKYIDDRLKYIRKVQMA